MIEYATLYFLLFRGFYSLNNKRITNNDKFLFPIILSVLYAFSDEIHQTLAGAGGRRRFVLFLD